MNSDAALMERSLLALAERGIEIRHTLYERFFAAFPGRREAFLCPHATSIRMTDETLQIMYGLAAGEDWVWTLVAELIGTHRSYGHLPLAEYEAFIDLAVDELASALGDDCPPACHAAWQRQASRFKQMVADASDDWNRILPVSGTLQAAR